MDASAWMKPTRARVAVVILVPAAVAAVVAATAAFPSAAWALRDAHAWHDASEGMQVALALFAGALGIRAYLKSGFVRSAALGTGLLGSGSVLLGHLAVSAAAGGGNGTIAQIVAYIILASAIVATPITSITVSVPARRRIAGMLLTTVGIGAAVGLAYASGGGGLGGVAVDPVVVALAFVAAAAAAGAFLVAASAFARGRTGLRPSLPLGAGLVAAAALNHALATALGGDALWGHGLDAIAVGVLALDVLRLAAAVEREDVAVTAAQVRAERLSSLGTLVAGVAHEVNNPLMYVRGNVELAVMDLQDLAESMRETNPEITPRLEEVVGSLQASLDGTERIARISTLLRTVARQDTGDAETVDVNDIARGACDLARVGLPDRVDLVVETGRSPVVVLASASELHQVVLNLAKNGIEAVDAAGGGSVRVRVTHRDHVAELVVQDTGPGIPDDHRPRLFTPFFTTKPRGTGLGLSIVHTIVKNHGGEVLVDSSSSGTTFRVRFPIAEKSAVEQRLEEIF